MIYHLTILGKLPSLNEYIGALNVSIHWGAHFKKKYILQVEEMINEQLEDLQIENPVFLKYRWYEINKKRDLDNVCSGGMKIIHDAFVSCGLLKNDNIQNIVGFTHEFFIDKNNPRIELTIVEVEENADKNRICRCCGGSGQSVYSECD